MRLTNAHGLMLHEPEGSGGNRTVDERLVELAKEVQKRDATLTGFKMHTTEAKSIAPGGTVPTMLLT